MPITTDQCVVITRTPYLKTPPKSRPLGYHNHLLRSLVTQNGGGAPLQNVRVRMHGGARGPARVVTVLPRPPLVSRGLRSTVLIVPPGEKDRGCLSDAVQAAASAGPKMQTRKHGACTRRNKGGSKSVGSGGGGVVERIDVDGAAVSRDCESRLGTGSMGWDGADARHGAGRTNGSAFTHSTAVEVAARGGHARSWRDLPSPGPR